MTKDLVPPLHIPRHPLWLAAYEGAWELWWRGMNHAAVDACMAAMFARYARDTLPLTNWLDHFYDTNAASPLLAWIEWELYQATADAARLTRVLPYLIKSYEWHKAQRRRESGLYWDDAPANGMNSPRAAHEWIDLSAQQALAAECIAKMARALGQIEVERRFSAEWKALCDLINRFCWDEREQFYFDRCADGSRSNVKTVAGLWPLLAGVPSAAQVEALVAHLLNPQEFWRVHVFPSLSADHSRYADRGAAWRGSVWPTPNYALIKGLERYGRHELAFRAADNHITTVSHVFKETHSLWENYAPDYIEPGSIARPDDVVAGLGAIALLIETILGLRVDAPACTLHWRPRLRESYSIEQLRCGESEIHLRVSDGHQARIVASAPLQLHLITNQGEQWIDVADEAIINGL